MTTQAETAPRPSTGVAALVVALTDLRDALRSVRFPLATPTAAQARHTAAGLAGQLDDYLLPRLHRLDAPVLVVVGGSTGAGKSTLVNSLVRVAITPAGVLRPTTRSPVLVCHPDDATWFTGPNVLPHLARTVGPPTGPDGSPGLRVVSAETIGPGLALLDAPDIDSVVDANRELAEQLLAAADLWLFVTTAARYADAVPWEVLRTARERGTAIALILDRVPPGPAADEIAPHLSDMLDGHGLPGVAMFIVAESHLDDQGLLPDPAAGPLRDWLTALSQSAAARAAVVRQTLDGAVMALAPGVAELASVCDEQVSTAETLQAGVRSAYAAAETAVERGILDGQVLRGEVLARWQELVGAGEFMRGLQARVGRVRDRVVAAVTGRPASTEQLQVALESGLVTLIASAAADAAEQASTNWQATPPGAVILAGRPELRAPANDLTAQTRRLVRDWQRAVLELVRAEAGNRRYVARVGAYAVNALGLIVMIAVFTATSFIPTGAEVVVAGGTTIAAQKVLEAIFGDQAVRALADKARVDLLRRVGELLTQDGSRFVDVLRDLDIDRRASDQLRGASNAVRAARAATALPTGTAIPKPTGWWRR